MCGRYALTIEAFQLKVFLDEAFSFFGKRDFSGSQFLKANPPNDSFSEDSTLVRLPHYNISPGTTLPIIRIDEETGSLVLDFARWGLIPSWVKKPKDEALKDSFKLTNARMETVADKPSFRSAFARNRILVPMTGYYEWKSVTSDNVKQPFYIHSDKMMFALGIRDVWQSKIMGTSDENIETFCLLTKNASPKLARIHQRSLLIMNRSLNGFQTSVMNWLSNYPISRDEWIRESSRTLIDDREIEMNPVSTFVNSTSNNSPECMVPIQETVLDLSKKKMGREEKGDDSQMTFLI